MAKSEASKNEKDKAKADATAGKAEDKAIVTAPQAAKPIKTANKSLLDDAYPDMLSIAATALDFWTKGKTEASLANHCCSSILCAHTISLLMQARCL